MQRLHVHVSVKDLDASVRFYSQLFANDPTVRRSDYAIIEEGETTCCYARSEESWIDDPAGRSVGGVSDHC